VKGSDRGKKKCRVYTIAHGEPEDSVRKSEEWEISNGISLQLTQLGVGPLWWNSEADVPFMEGAPTVPIVKAKPKPKPLATATSSKKRKRQKSRKNRAERNRDFQKRELTKKLSGVGSKEEKLELDRSGCPKPRKINKKMLADTELQEETDEVVEAEMEEDESERSYTVEKILGHKRVKGKDKYLVKWEGYSAEENTWEPTEMFDDPATISNWWKQQAQEGYQQEEQVASTEVREEGEDY